MSMRYSVHIVDDDAGMRESLKALLDSAGFDAQCYPSAECFLEHSAGLEGCALIDLKMHKMSGLALQQRLIAEQSNLDLIMMSAYGEVADAVQAMRRGAIDFLEKPFAPEQMLARVRSLQEIRNREETHQREARRSAALIELLTPRETQILRMLVDGMANKQAAQALNISVRTVETHRVRLMDKLEAESLPHLVRIWLASGHHVDMPKE